MIYPFPSGRLARRLGLLLVAAFALLASPVLAGQQLGVRLVEASGGPARTDPALKDVEAMLKGNLPFSQFRLVDRTAVRLPAIQQATDLKGGVVMRFNGDQQKLAVTMEQGGRVVLQTQIALHDGIPLVLGGFPSGGGRMMIVLVVR